MMPALASPADGAHAGTWMWREILETPAIVESLLRDDGAEIAAAAAAIRRLRPRVAVIVGRGTSDHAGIYARYLVELALGIPVALAAASLTTVYQAKVHWKGVLLLALSQSGVSPDVVEVTRVARAGGALAIALTNEPQSALAAVADHVVALRAGEERAVAATKTYVAELAAIVALITRAAERPEAEQLDRLPEALDQTVTAARSWLAVDDGPAAAFARADRTLVVSRGLNLATALEVALKLKETARSFAGGYSSADLMHGPVSLAGADVPILAIRPDGSIAPSIDAGLARVRDYGGEPWLVGGAELAESPAGRAAPGSRVLALDLGLPEVLTPIPYVVPGQLLAEAVARARGFDPDAPAGLTKVTRTL